MVRTEILYAANCAHCATGGWASSVTIVRRQFGAGVSSRLGPIAITVENAKRLRALKTGRPQPTWRTRREHTLDCVAKG